MQTLTFIVIMYSLFIVTRGFVSQSFRSTARHQLAMMARKKKEMPANPVAVVTGASRGIGKAIALALGL